MAEPTGLQAAAQRKRAATRQRATAALGELADTGAEITFQSVARHADVSRQWLYGQPDLRAQIEQVRQRPRGGVPVRERSSDASLRQRLRGLLDDNRTLRDEVHALKAELAGAYGTQRANAAGAPRGRLTAGVETRASLITDMTMSRPRGRSAPAMPVEHDGEPDSRVSG